MVRKLTVLQMLPALEGGGVERGTLEVAKALADAGHRSLVMSAGGRMVEELLADGSEHFTWPVDRKSLWTLRLVPRLRRFLREQQVDIVHVRSRVPAWVAWLAWRGMDAATRPRFVTTVHGLYSVNAYSRVMTRGERVIAVSETVREYILVNYPGADASGITVIPRGIDPAEFPYGYSPPSAWWDQWYRQHPQFEHAKVLTLPGRVTRLKGHRDFLEVIARLRAAGLPVHGVIVGDSPASKQRYRASLDAMAVQLGVAPYLTYLGHRRDVRDIYAASDLVFSLSKQPESFGRTVLEALSLGRPVVGYAHGGVEEILRAMYPQGMVPFADLDALVRKAMQLILGNEKVANQVKFPKSSMIEKTLRLYRELCRAANS